MKIAYLITAYNNYLHLRRLVEALSEPDAAFYIHIDGKSPMPQTLDGLPNVRFIERIAVSWGGWSHQQAILNLLSAAVEGRADRYVLLSGGDYPIRPNEFLRRTLAEGWEHINILRGFQDHKPAARVRRYHFDSFDRRDRRSVRTLFFLALEAAIALVYTKGKFPFEEIYHGSTWWALTHDCVAHVLARAKADGKLVEFFKSSWCPEESFVHTIIGSSAFLQRCRNNLTYTDWSVKPGPAFITERHVELFKHQVEFEGPYGTYRPFFARKFSDDSTPLVALIERELRSRPAGEPGTTAPGQSQSIS